MPTAGFALAEDGAYELFVGTSEFGNGTTTVHGQIAASLLATTVDRVRIRQSDTDLVPHDTGAFGSTGTVVAGAATRAAAAALAEAILDFAAAHFGARSTALAGLAADHVVAGARVIALDELAKAAIAAGAPLERAGHSAGTPRSVAFNVQGFEVAVHRRYGEIRILRSIHAADAGAVVNPMQCRGQVEGGVMQAIGAAL